MGRNEQRQQRGKLPLWVSAPLGRGPTASGQIDGAEFGPLRHLLGAEL